MAGSDITCEFTLDDAEDTTVDVVIDWDSANPGTIMTNHPGLSSNGVTHHSFTQHVPEDREYIVKITAVDSASNSAVATRSIQVVGDQGPQIVILSLTSV